MHSVADPWGGYPLAYQHGRGCLPLAPPSTIHPSKGLAQTCRVPGKNLFHKRSSITFHPRELRAEKTGTLLTSRSRPIGRWALKAPKVVYKTPRLTWQNMPESREIIRVVCTRKAETESGAVWTQTLGW